MNDMDIVLYPIRIVRKMIFCLTYYAYSINLPSFSVVCVEVNLSAVCLVCTVKKVKVAHTRSPSVGFRSSSRFLVVSLQET